MSRCERCGKEIDEMADACEDCFADMVAKTKE